MQRDLVQKSSTAAAGDLVGAFERPYFDVQLEMHLVISGALDIVRKTELVAKQPGLGWFSDGTLLQAFCWLWELMFAYDC
jgi:hypothetical protein